MNDNDEAVTLAMKPAMTPERWQQIEQVFYAAREREPHQRATFLAEACAGENALRQEVEALLAQAEAEGSLEALPAVVAAEVLAVLAHAAAQRRALVPAQ